MNNFSLKKFKFKKIYAGYLKSFATIALTAFIGYNIIMFGYLYYNQLSSNKSTSTDLALKSGAILDTYFSQVYNVISNCISNDTVMQYIEMPSPVSGDINEIRKISRIISHIQTQLYTYPDIKNIYIYSKINGFAISGIDSGYIEKYKDKIWYDTALNDETASFSALSSENSKNIYIVQKLHKNGCIIVEIESDELRSLIPDTMFTVMYTQNGAPFYSSGTDCSAIFEKEEISGLKDGNFKLKKENGSIYILTKSKYWFSYVFKYDIKMFSSNALFYIIIFGGGALFLLFLVYLSFVQATKTYSYISNIMGILNSDTDEGSNEYNEWVYISNHLINLIDQNSLIQSTLRTRLEELKRAQNIALQLQINPHFLFNTLYIATLDIQNEIKGDCTGTKMITILSEILRLVLNTKENMILFEEEINYSKKYIELEMLKYKDSIEVLWNIEKDALPIKVPKLILQPILENSIIHGRDDEKLLTISISAHREGDGICIEISDNGNGIDDKKLSGIRERIKNSSFPEDEHIGLLNVAKRFDLIYGGEHTFNIYSSVGRGTRTVIMLPEI